MPSQPSTGKTLSTGRTLALGTLSVVLALVVLFAIAEISLRVLARETDYIPKPWIPVLQDHYYLRSAPIPNASYRSERASVSINSRGFRGKEFAVPKPRDHYRIFALGGSTTFGYFPSISSDEQTFPGQLERLLNVEKPEPDIRRYEVVNAGVPGYSVRTSTHNFVSRILHYQPDAIIVYHNTNDLARYGAEEELERPLQSLYVEQRPLAVLFDALFGWSYAMQELRFSLSWRLPLLRGNKPAIRFSGDEWEPDMRYAEAFRRDLRNLVILAKANGVTPVLVTQSIAITEKTDFSHLTPEELNMQLAKPDIHHARIPLDQRYRMFQLYNQIIRDVARAEQVPFVDANAAIPKMPQYHWDYCHLTDRGSELLARAIYQKLWSTRPEPAKPAQSTPVSLPHPLTM